MPLRLPSVKSRKKKRAGSQESVASTDPLSKLDTIPPVVSDECMSTNGYVIPKDKDLPKLHRAAWKGDLVKVQQITKSFKKNEVNAVDKEKRTALHLATARGHRDIIQHLCGLGANVKLCDKDGCTPVHKALESGHCSSLECLLNSGGDANMPDKRGRRPLHLAAYHGNIAATTLLLERDAVLEELDGESNTALHIAVLRGNGDLAASLLQDGAHVNATDGKGCTPLMLAAREGRATLVKLLANHEDTDPDLTDEGNFKAIDYAITRNHIECAQLIEECEKVKAAEKLRQSQLPRKPSLVNESLIAEVFGLQLPAQKGKEGAPTKSEATLTQSEDPPTQASISEGGWESSDDEDWGSKPSNKVNLKAGLKKAMSASNREPEVAPQPAPSPDPAPKTVESLSSKKETPPTEAPPTSPAQPQHYQLTTQPATEPDLAPAGELEEEGVGFGVSESDNLSIGSGFDSDSISLPLSPLTKPMASPLGLGLMKSDHVTKPESHMTAGGAKAPVAKDGEPQEKKSKELNKLAQQKIPAVETKPEPAVKSQHGTEQGDETSDFDSDSDSNLDSDTDLPGFGAYTPSTPSASPGRAALLKQRRDSDLSLKGKMAASVEKNLPGPTDAITSPSAITEVTPMSSGVFTPDMLSGSYPKGRLMLGSPVENVPELPGDSDGETGALLAEAERVEKTLLFSEEATGKESNDKKEASQKEEKGAEESDGEIDVLLAKAEKVEKTLLFSEKKEEATGKESDDQKEVSEKAEEGADGISSEWDSTESEDDEIDVQQKSASSQPGTSGNGACHVARSPSARVATAGPRRVISNDFGDTDSEDDFEMQILPREELSDKQEAVNAPSLTLEAAILHISPRYSSSTLTEVTSTSPANTPREITIPEKQDPILEEKNSIPEILLFSEKKEEATCKESNNKKEVSRKVEEGADGSSSEWDSTESEEEEIDMRQKSASSQPGTSGNGACHVARSPSARVATAGPRRVISNDFGYTYSEDDFEMQILPREELSDKQEAANAPSLTLEATILHISPRYSSSTLTEVTSTSPADTPRDITIPEKQDPITEEQNSIPEKQDPIPEEQDPIPEEQDPIPEKQDPKQNPTPLTPEPTHRLTHEQLVQAVEGTDDLEHVQYIIGHALYHDVYQLQPLLARKITGMLMMMESSDLLYMLEPSRHEVLKSKVDEAADLLRSLNYFSDPEVDPTVTQAEPRKSCKGVATPPTEVSSPERTASTSGESETESEWEREQRVKKLERKGRSQLTDSGLDTKPALAQATGEQSKDLEIPKTVSEEATSDPALENPRDEQSLGVKRSPSEEATSWLKEKLGMPNPASQQLEQRKETTAVSTGDLQAVKKREEMEDEASRRLYKRNNEFLLLVKSKRSTPVGFEGNPLEAGAPPTGRVLLVPIPTPTCSEGMEYLDKEPIAGISRGSSKVQMMRQKFESGATLGPQGDMDETSTVNPQTTGSKSDPHASEAQRENHVPTAQATPLEQDKKAEVDTQQAAQTSSALRLLEPVPPGSGLEEEPSLRPPVDQGASDASDDEILEELSVSEEEESETPPPKEELPKTAKLPVVADEGLQVAEAEVKLQVTVDESAQKEEQLQLTASAPTKELPALELTSSSGETPQPSNAGLHTSRETPQPSNAGLHTSGETPKSANAGLHTSGETPQPSNAGLLTSGETPKSANAGLHTSGETPQPSNAGLHTSGETPQPSNAGLLTSGETPKSANAGLHTSGETPQPSNAGLLTSGETPKSANAGLHTSGETPQPSNAGLHTSGETPQPSNAGLLTSGETPKSANAGLHTSGETPQPSNAGLHTGGETPKSANTGLHTSGETPQPSNAGLHTSGETPQPSNAGLHTSGETPPQTAAGISTRMPKKARKIASKSAAQTKKEAAKRGTKVTKKDNVSPRAKTTPPNRGAGRSESPPPLGHPTPLMFMAPPLGGVSAKTEVCHYSSQLSSRDRSGATSPDSSISEPHTYTPHFHASTLPTPLPVAHSTLTTSQLDTSPLRLHHLAITPSPPHSLTRSPPHSLMRAPEENGKMNQHQSGVLSGSHSFGHGGSQSDLTNNEETQSHDPLSASYDPPTESHDPLSASYDPPTESHDLFADLPFGHMTRLSQSAGTSLLGSAQVSQLQESLRQARRGLERNQDALAACERSKRQLDSQLDDSQRKYDETFAAKLKLESSKLELELQVRELKYSMEQERESRHSSEAVTTQLREQLGRTEDRVSREIEARQGAELRKREVEIEQRSLAVINQQLQEQVAELNAQLLSERDSRVLQDGLYKEQIRMFQRLQEESHRAQKQNSDVLSQLQAADTSKHTLEEKLVELQRLNSQLQVDLTSEKRRGEDRVTRLEAELESVKEQLQEQLQDKVATEDALLKAKQEFEANLSELRSKAELLSSTLDKEAGEKKAAREEVSSLRSRLEQENRELHEMARKKAEGEQKMSHALEELQRDKALLQRDLATARESSHQLSGRLEALSQRMAQSDSEARAQQAALLERTNQMAMLQRELDQRQVKLQAAGDSVRRERGLVGQLEAQLSSLREQLSGSEAECSKLRVEVERAGHRVDEKETSSQQQQQQLTAMFDSLRADSEKMKAALEARQQSLVEQLMSVKEDSVRKEAESANSLRELSQLQKEHLSLRAAYSELQETLSATEEAFRELEGEKEEEVGKGQQLEESVAALQKELAASEQNNQVLGEKTAALRRQLAQVQERRKAAESAKEETLNEKVQLESEMASLRGQLVALEGELETSHRGEGQLQAQLEHLNQIRSDLERTASRLQGEVVGLQAELGEARGVQERATREAEEARCLWEAEVKSRSKLGMKVLEMERSQTDVGSQIEAERKRTRKAMELRRMAEIKFESLQERNAQLLQEAAGLRTQVKVAKKQVRQMEANESQLPGLRAEFDREQLSLQTEMAALKRQLESTQDQLCRESELRVKADHSASRARQELEATTTRITLSQSQSQAKQKELQKLEESNRKLREELRALQDHLATSTVSKAELETYRRMVEEKAQQELNRKLEEVNCHLAQQSQAHDALERLRTRSESEWKHKLERSSEELRLALAQAIADKRTAAAEADRFKELYENQLWKCEKLSGKLQKIREEAMDSKTRLNLERNRTQHLLNATQSSAIRVASPIGPHHHTHTTSTPLRPRGTVADHSSTEELLSSVRMELDRSIARHLDSVPSAPRATRSTYRSTDSILQGPQSSSHLDAIKRTYHV